MKAFIQVPNDLGCNTIVFFISKDDYISYIFGSVQISDFRCVPDWWGLVCTCTCGQQWEKSDRQSFQNRIHELSKTWIIEPIQPNNVSQIVVRDFKMYLETTAILSQKDGIKSLRIYNSEWDSGTCFVSGAWSWSACADHLQMWCCLHELLPENFEAMPKIKVDRVQTNYFPLPSGTHARNQLLNAMYHAIKQSGKWILN
jgi:hypothetical protein